MSDLENDELNRQLCAVATEEIFESWPPEIQQQVLAEWNDWREKKPGHCCEQCAKRFTRSNDLKRHVRRVHSDERPYACGVCGKGFATKDELNRHEKVHKEKSFECQRCHKKFSRKVWYSNG